MIHVHPGRLLRALIVVNCLLLGGFILFQYVHLPLRSVTRLFDVTAEASVPAWYSGMLLATAGALALLRAVTLRQESRAWLLYATIGAGLLFLSADEVGQIHETISGGLHKHLGADAATTDDASHWDVVTLGLYLLVAGAVLLTFRRQATDLFLRSPGRRSILAGGILYALGAAGIDQVQWIIPFRLGAVVEDGCELFGATLMLHGFLLNLGTVTLSTKTDPADAAPARERRDAPPAPNAVLTAEPIPASSGRS